MKVGQLFLFGWLFVSIVIGSDRNLICIEEQCFSYQGSLDVINLQCALLNGFALHSRSGSNRQWCVASQEELLQNTAPL